MKKYQRVLWLGLSLLWMTVIFMFSSQKGSSSSALSSSVTRHFIQLFYPSFQNLDLLSQNDLLNTIHTFIRKLAHFTEYGILWFCFYHFLRSYDMSSKKAYLLAVVFCFLYASSDEFHQAFVPNRGPSFVDVLIDTSGACALGGIYLAIKKLFYKSI